MLVQPDYMACVCANHNQLLRDFYFSFENVFHGVMKKQMKANIEASALCKTLATLHIKQFQYLQYSVFLAELWLPRPNKASSSWLDCDLIDHLCPV